MQEHPRIVWWWCSWLAVGFALLATFRIVDSYGHLSHAYDEPYHILRGVQWLEGATYQHTEHPPLGPAVCALWPCLGDVHRSRTGDKQTDGLSIVYGNGDYRSTLASFRAGNLVFLWVACGVVFVWTGVRSHPWKGCVAVLALTHMPTVLAHSGLVTTDMPLTAMLLAAAASFDWAVCGKTDFLRWSIAGVVLGLALLSKFSILLYCPIAAVAVLVLNLSQGDGRATMKPALTIGTGGAIYALLAAVVVWSAYDFSVGPLRSIRIQEYRFGGFPRSMEELPVPAPSYLAGIIWTRQKLEAGNASYFWGETTETGSPWFFPVLLAVKTPLVLLLLALIGSGQATVAYVRRQSRWGFMILLTFALSLLATVPSTINLGVRHVLPLFPLLAILSAEGIAAVVGGFRCLRPWLRNRSPGERLSSLELPVMNAERDAPPKQSRSRRACRSVQSTESRAADIRYNGLACGVWLTLLAWLSIDTWTYHPHYLGYFNELARWRRTPIAIDSDLDWGQGILELETTCREQGIEHLRVDYFGTCQLDHHDLPPPPENDTDAHWLAISAMLLFTEDAYRELRDRVPDAVIAGGAMKLYFVRGNH